MNNISESPLLQQQILFQAMAQQQLVQKPPATDFENSKETVSQEIDPTSYSAERGGVSNYHAASAIDPSQQSQNNEHQGEGSDKNDSELHFINSSLQLQELRQGKAKASQPLPE